MTPAGLLHHFESKEQLLHAVLDARDLDDESHADRSGDLIAQISQVAERFRRAPELLGTFTVLLVENILPDAPLHDRMLARHQHATEIVAAAIRRGQADGSYRFDIDPAVKAVEILAFIHGMETLWLLDPSIPLTEVFKQYAEALARDFAPTRTSQTHDMRYRLDVVASSVLDVVRFAGGWLFDRSMAGWDVTVLLSERADDRPLQILGAQTMDLEHALASGRDPSPTPSPCGRGGSVRVRLAGAQWRLAGPRSRRHRGHAVGGDLAGRARRQRRPGATSAEHGRADIQGAGAGRGLS